MPCLWAGVLGRGDLSDLLAMARFGIRAVHLYADLDAASIWEIVAGGLPDLERFVAAVATR
jgi:uncharacterized protein YutE (UPF0331/DUF86 family)